MHKSLPFKAIFHWTIKEPDANKRKNLKIPRVTGLNGNHFDYDSIVAIGEYFIYFGVYYKE